MNGPCPGNAYLDPTGPSNRFREPPFGQPGVELVEHNRQDDDHADDDCSVGLPVFGWLIVMSAWAKVSP